MTSIKLGLAALSLVTLSTVALAGCSADASDDALDEDMISSEDAIRAQSLVPGTFKLYADPGHQANPSCDLHTALELTNQNGARAKLREVVGGFCEIFADPQPREYRLRYEGTSCGSVTYRGQKKIAGKLRSIKITDHRSRVCRDLVPAKIIVEETGINGGTSIKYSAPDAPAPATSTWLTYAPRQCGTNPWNDAKDPSDEKGQVDRYFSGLGISLEQVGFAYPSEPRIVCMACSCPRGDSLVVKATTAADAAKLVADHGFAPLEGALATGPKQCGTNPWEGGAPLGDDRAESSALASWAKASGAELLEVGFLDYTEPRMVCMACSCPRGDTAIAIPKTPAAAAKLVNLGWQRVEN